ncbi:hypothetical protein ES702_04842 [subsurface metagenome]
MNKKLLLIGISFMLVIVGFCGCTEDSGKDGNNGVYPPGPPPLIMEETVEII